MAGDCVLLTGGTGVLGRAIARYLVDRGWALVVTSRNEGRARMLADELGPNAAGFALDLSVSDCTEGFAERLSESGLTVSHLVNNARALESLQVQPDGTSAPDDFMAELAIDVVQPYRLTVALANHSAHPLQAVVNIGSQYGEVAMHPVLYEGMTERMPVQYGVAKAALHHLTRELAVRLAPNTRVNSIAFGGFAGRASTEFSDRYSGMVPAGRMLEPAEAGGPVAFLLGEESSSMTGHIMIADGGWSLW